MTNEALRDHVTNVAFSLTLSKTQLHLLVLLHHFRGARKLLSNRAATRYTFVMRQYVGTVQGLQTRGLVTDVQVKDSAYLSGFGPDTKLTKAGTLLIGILKEAGIYDDQLALAGIEKKETAA